MSMHSRPNSWVAKDDAATTTLTYGLQVNPAPLTVSIAGESPVMGSLAFVVTNPTNSPVAVTSVSFSFSVGVATDGTNLTASTANVGTQVSDTVNWMIQSPGTVTSGLATYTLKPQVGTSGSIAAHSSLVVQIFNFATVQNPGNTTLTVKEVIGQSSGFVNFQVTTFPTGFYFNSLAANVASGSLLTPVAQVAAGTPVTLTWNSSIVSLTSFQIYYSSASQGQQKASPTDTGEWLSPPLTSDTVFTVVVTVAIEGGAPLSASLATAVAVQNPALIAASITAGAATINGAITATGLTVNGSASVTGNIKAASLNVSGATALGNVTADNLNVGGISTLGAVTAQSVRASALTSTANANIVGTLTVGNVMATGVVSTNMLRAATATTPPDMGWSAPAGACQNSYNGATVTTNVACFLKIAGAAFPFGVYTNGLVASLNGKAPITQLQSSKGPRVVTSPLSLHPVLMFSGSGSVYNSAQVTFDADVAEMIAGSAYEVMVTPTMAGGAVQPGPPISVGMKSASGFAVFCNGFASFDWVVFARKAKAPGSSEPDDLPPSLPDFPKTGNE